MKPQIIKPFQGDYPVTLAFGVLPKNHKIRKQYKRWGLKGHNGIDFNLPEGTPTLACYKGKVLMSGDYRDGYGVLVKLAHDWGESLYAHLKKSLVKINKEVKQGEIIGYSGGTGFTTRKHLHFAIRVKPFDRRDGYFGWSDPGGCFS